MSTNAYIGKVNKDSTVTAIYSHWDGYIEYMGKGLNSKFNEPNQVDELISGGDISSIDRDGKVNYYNDRGEPWDQIKPENFTKVSSYIKFIKTHSHIEYGYLYIIDTWYVLLYDEFVKIDDIKCDDIFNIENG